MNCSPPIQKRLAERFDIDGLMRHYLRRLGADAADPSPTALIALHRAQVERVPYETFWLHLRQGWAIDQHESLERIASGRRGGYCFHLNPVFAALLAWLGYRVTLHVAGVHDAEGPDRSMLGNHVAVLVHDLPDGSNPGGIWYVDAGLGDGPHEPMPLVPGTFPQGPSTFTLTNGDRAREWALAVDPVDSYAGVSIVTPPVTIDVFEPRHHFNTTSPQSSFARTVTAQRRTADTVQILRGCVLTSRTATRRTTHTFDQITDWTDALVDVFGIELDAPSEELDRLWTRVRRQHRLWLDDGHHGSTTVP